MAQDNTQVHRLLRLLHILHAGRSGNAACLAEQLSVDVRTIYRDLNVLADIGVVYCYDEDTRRYIVGKDAFLPPLHLTGAEALALTMLVRGVAGGDQQIAQTGPASKALEKVRAQLPAGVRQELGELDGHIDIRLPATGPDGEATRDVYDEVRSAITQRRTLLCRYDSLSTDADRAVFELRPYALSFDNRAWYVVGHHAGRDAVRRLKLNRFTDVQPTDKPYAIPHDFSLADERGNAWRMIRGDTTYDVAIRFDADFAETVADTNWHPTQQINDHPDGSITFHCRVDGLDEIVWWVLGYGPKAVVEQPTELAERVRKLAKATAERYS